MTCLGVILLLSSWIGGCNRNEKGPPDEDTPPEQLEFDGTIFFSGTYEGNSGLHAVDLKTRVDNHFSTLQAANLQAADGGKILLVTTATGEVDAVDPATGDTRLLATALDAFLAPNGRRFFYHNFSDGLLYEGHIGATGGRAFPAEAHYASYSPTLDRIAFLNAAGVAFADPALTEGLQADLSGLLKENEMFVVPTTGDYFPRWAPDGSRIAAALTVGVVDGTSQRGLIVVIDRDGVSDFYLTNNARLPTWSADGSRLYYVSEDIIYAWDFSAGVNVYITGSNITTNSRLRLDREDTYLAFVQGNSEGLTGLFILDLANNVTLPLVPYASNGASAVDWPRAAFCDAANAAPQLTAAEVWIDGIPAAEPVITPATTATIVMTVTDADCNLAMGAALYDAGAGAGVLSLALPTEAGCDGQAISLPAPLLADGAYNLTVSVEDVCGTASDGIALSVTYAGGGTDDDDDTSDDDTAVDDDTGDDDTTDDDTGGATTNS